MCSNLSGSRSARITFCEKRNLRCTLCETTMSGFMCAAPTAIRALPLTGCMTLSTKQQGISQNVARGKRMGYKHGKFAFPYGRIIGYRKGADGKPEIIPEQAEVIRLIFNSYLQGDSLQSIKTKLETAGALTARGNTEWSAQSIRRENRSSTTQI